MLYKSKAIELMLFKISKLFKSSSFIIYFGLFAILPFILISFFIHPSVDDFCYNIQSRDLGFWTAQLTWYNDWTGRYFTSAILSIKPLVSGSFFIYKLIPVILLSSLFVSIYYLSSLLFVNLKRKGFLVFTFYFVTIYLMQMPSVAQGFYWLPGSISYQLPSILSILFLCSLIQLIKTNNWKYLLTSIFLVFFIIGSSETSMLLIDFLIGTIFIYKFYRDKKINKSILILLIFAMLFSLVVIISPANIIRSSNFPYKHQLFNSIFNSLLAFKNYLAIWLPLIILFTFIFYDYFRQEIGNYSSKIFNINPIFVFIIVCCIPFIGFFPGYWSLGGDPPLRTINTIYFYFLTGFIYFTFVVFFYLKQKSTSFLSFSKGVKYLLFVLIFIYLGHKNNVKTAYADLIKGKAYKYDLELKERYKKINNSKNDTIYVSKLKHRPSTIFFDDITSNPSNWKNECYDSYFKHKIIITNRE